MELSAQDNSIDFALANFGNIPYGRKINGELIISSPISGCSHINSTVNQELNNIFFVIMKIGDCSIAKKAINA